MALHTTYQGKEGAVRGSMMDGPFRKGEESCKISLG